MPLEPVSLDKLTIDDDRSLRHIAVYHELKALLRVSGYRFYKPVAGTQISWDRALFLNQTFWNGSDGADVLQDEHIAADVVAHIAWHYAVDRELARTGSSAEQRRSPAALFFAEAISSAFDLYLVGRMLLNAPDSDFITSQVPIMGEAAEEAGLSEEGFMALLEQVSSDPERSFEDLRVLLFDICSELFALHDAAQAEEVLQDHSTHRFAPLLHHYQLSNWILYARAFGTPGMNEWVAKADAELRRAPDPLIWLSEHLLAP
jgi:hypothetical protein